jgi:N4-gp56 family major capsid protein
MAANTRNDFSSSGLLQEWLQREFLLNFNANLYFAQFSEAPDFPEGYETLRWAKFTPILEGSVTTGTSATDGVTASDTSIAVTSVTTTPTQYRIVCDLSDLLLSDNPLPLLAKTAERVAYVMALVVDSTIQTTIMAGSNVIYANGQASRTALSTTSVLSTTELNKASSLLRASDAPDFDGWYYAVIHPYCLYDLRNQGMGTSASYGGWIDVAKYSRPEDIFKGEVGALFNVRLFVSSHINTFASTHTVFPTLVFGKQAYGVGWRQRPQIFITDMVPSDSDPAAQRRKVAGKVAFGVVRLQENAMQRIESGASLST